MRKRKLDELDKKIINFVSTDARISNRKIADVLGVSEGTIRGRIRRLEKDKIIRITAVTDFSSFQKPMILFIGVQVAQNRVNEVADKIKELPIIGFVATLLGRYSILAIAPVKNTDEISKIINDEIIPIPGVLHTETSISLQNIKYDYRWGRIL